ncbi:GH92 family glycosyl hydrolase, partial [uncultured Alistipes sp.]|uniref:GH92 family glycosyl hydrolase n=1 Tax=uncultured Alistipes sp. TaxID=538949 RepID=UPI002584956C
MKRTLAFLLGIVLSAGCCPKPAAPAADPVDYVSTLVGTQSKYELSTGNTYPAIARPWGMNFWTPQTGRMGNGWTYTYTDDKIRGFKQTHQPSPWINDYGQFALMPVTSGPVFDEDARASWFSHKAEVAKPYYYSAYLADHDVTVEITPTERAAMFRLTYPEAERSYLVVDAFDSGSEVRVLPDMRHIVGYTTKNSGGVPANFRNWFVIESDTPFQYVAAVADGLLAEGTAEASADHAGAVVGFRTRQGQQVQLRVASSFISAEQAELNLRELGGDSFDAVVAAGRDRWNEVLGRIEIEDDNVDNLRTFYSCLYRSVLFPRDLSEIDAAGNRVHYSPFDGTVRPGYLFTDTGFWDTFRSLFPLLNLVYPEMNARMQEVTIIEALRRILVFTACRFLP